MASQRREHSFMSLAARSYRLPSWSTPGMFLAKISFVFFPPKLSAPISRSSPSIGLPTEIFGWSRISYVISSPVTSTYPTRSTTK